MKRGHGEGSYVKYKGGRWRVFTPPLPPHNKRKSYTSTRSGIEGRKECQEWLREFMRKHSHGLPIEAEVETVEELLHEWLRSITPTIRDQTYYEYEGLVRNHIAPHHGHRKFKKLRAADIQSLYNFLREQGGGTRLIQRVHGVYRSALNFAKRMEWIHTNPALMVVIPTHKPRKRQIWTVDQVRSFLSFIQGHRMESMIYLAIATGMRLGEELALLESDVDVATGTIYVNKQIVRPRGGGYKIEAPKTDKGIRTVIVGQTGIQHVLEQKRRNEIAKMTATEWEDNGFLFPNAVGRPQWRAHVYEEFKNLCQEAGVSMIPWHYLRHIDASILLDRFHSVAVSTRLGHSKPSVTTDIYGHTVTPIQREMAEYIDEMLSIPEIPADQFRHREKTAPLKDDGWMSANLHRTNDDIAEELGCHPGVVQRYRRAYILKNGVG